MKTFWKIAVISGSVLALLTPAMAMAKGPVISATDYITFILMLLLS